MLLNHLKHRSYQVSHISNPSASDVNVWTLMKGGPNESSNPVLQEASIQDETSKRLVQALNDSKKELSRNKAEEKSNSFTDSKMNNLFKKRVDEFFKKREPITAQQKFNTLAPTTINNITMTLTRNNPMTTTSFLAAPYDKNVHYHKRPRTPIVQRTNTDKLKNRSLLSHNVSQQDWMLTTEGAASAEKFFIQPSQRLNIKKTGINRNRSHDFMETAEIKSNSFQVPRYSSIDKTVEAFLEKSSKAALQKSTRNFEYSKIKLQNQFEPESNLNFRATSTKYLGTAENDFHPKEGSFMMYIRTQSVQPKNFPTRIPKEEKQKLGHARSRSVISNQQKNSQKSISNAESILESLFASNRSPEKSKSIRSITPANNKQQRAPEDRRRNYRPEMNSAFLLNQGNKKSPTSILAEDKNSNENEDMDYPYLDVSAIDLIQDETQRTYLKSQMQDFSADNFEMKTNQQEPPYEAKKALDRSLIQENITTKQEESSNNITLKPIENKVDPKNLNELLVYAKQKSQILETIISQNIQDIKLMKTTKFDVEEALAEASIAYIQGGLSQKTLGLLEENKNQDVPVLLQEDLKTVKKARDEVAQVNSKLEILDQKKKQLYTQCKEKLEQAKVITPHRVTNSELDMIRKEFMKKYGNIDVEKIDQPLNKLKFFSQLSKEIRSDFYNNARFLRFSKGAYVFHQGDEAGLMYVILRGNVSVKTERKFENGQTQLVTVNSLNDGAHFGELGIMGEKYRRKQNQAEKAAVMENAQTKNKKSIETSIPEKLAEINKLIITQPFLKTPTSGLRSAVSTPQSIRPASMQCGEETDVLAIDREKFQDILFSIVPKDLDSKIAVLQITPFFKGEDGFNLMPIANLMKTAQFKLGQRVIKTGDIVNNFYILAKGTCKVISEIIDGYPLNLDMFKEKLRPFNFKTPEKLRADKSRIHNADKGQEATSMIKRTFDQEPLIRSGKGTFGPEQNTKFVKHIQHNEFNKGDCFGIRSLIGAEDDDDNYVLNKGNRARLSMVADSGDVEIYILPRTSVSLIPEEVRNKLLNEVVNMVDFDEVNISEEIAEHRKWRNYQLDIIKKALLKKDNLSLSQIDITYKAT